MVVFDLDGTLVDTRLAVVEAYHMAGVKPADIRWGQPWHTWLKDPAAHEHKNYVYPIALKRLAKALPLLEVACRMRAPVITGASFLAVKAVCERFSVELDVRLMSARLEDKVAWLNAQGPGTYVDDDAAVRAAVEGGTPWDPISPEEYRLSF